MSDIFQKLVLQHIDQLKNSEELPLLCYSKIVEQSDTATPQIPETLKKQELPPYKAFKNATIGRIAHIRAKIELDEIDPNIENWCEKLLRYCEIRYNSLKKRAAQQKRTKEEIVKLYTQIISLFIEYYYKNGDLRYINIALKLMDYKWTKYPNTQNVEYLSAKILHERNLRLLDKILHTIEYE